MGGGASIWRVLSCCFVGPLFSEWAPGCYVRYGCIGSPVFSFPVDGGRGCLSTCSLYSVTVFCFASVASCLVLQV